MEVVLPLIGPGPTNDYQDAIDYYTSSATEPIENDHFRLQWVEPTHLKP